LFNSLPVPWLLKAAGKKRKKHMDVYRKFSPAMAAWYGAALMLFVVLAGSHLETARANAADAGLTAEEMESVAASAGRNVIRGAREIGRIAPGVFDGDLRDVVRSREWEPGDAVIERPRRTYPRRPPVRESAPAVPKPQIPQEKSVPEPDEPSHDAPKSRAFNTPLLNFDAATFTGVNPADPVGDVGPNHYIQMVNQAAGSQVRIYDKTGTLLAGPFTLATLWTAGGNCATGHGDPIVLYDPLADRWLLSEFASTGNHLCIYISQTADPVSGGWFLYDFTTPDFPDYPKYAVWPDAYYVSTNESDPAVYALDRVNMLAGLAATAQRFTGPALAGFPFQAFTPADLDGATAPPAGAPGLFMRHRDDEGHNAPGTAQDFLEIWEFHVDFATAANSTFTGPTNIAVTEFSSELCGLSSFSCFPQPSGINALDPLREVIMFRLQYRNFGTHQTLVGNFVTDADGEGGGDPTERGGIRWFELRKIDAGAWSLFQEGTHSPDANARWMGAIAMDGAGNIALGYSVAGASVFPSLRYAGREAGDAAGTLQAEVSLVAGSASNGSFRWGDYAAMSVDPSDDCTFWFTGLYSPTSQWRTRIGKFRFPSCAANPLTRAPLSLPLGEVDVAYSAPLVTGGTPPYDYILLRRTFPPGLNPDASDGTLDGTPDSPALLGRTFRVKITDQTGDSVTGTFRIKIKKILIITTNALPDGKSGRSYRKKLSASGGKTPRTWTLAGGSLPTNFSVSSTGVISGTTTDTGTFMPEFRVVDPLGGEDQKVLSLTID
jgi:hypothetical protein